VALLPILVPLCAQFLGQRDINTPTSFLPQRCYSFIELSPAKKAVRQPTVDDRDGKVHQEAVPNLRLDSALFYDLQSSSG
jgi:hypothetical protein